MSELVVLSISLPADLAEVVQRRAAQEKRSVSEVIQDTIRIYQREHEAWQQLMQRGQARSRELGISEDDVERLIDEYRAEQGTGRREAHAA